jgi:hypothetical protein
VKGQAFLALIFLIGGIVILVGVTLAFLVNSYVDTTYGYQALVSAQAVAISGAEDALLQFNRNGSSWNPGTYSVVVGSSTATVTVTQNSPATGEDTIVSYGTVSLRTGKVSVVAAVNASTSAVNVISWQQVQ